MRQLSDAMRAASAEPPPTAVDIDEIIAGHQRRRNRLRALAVGCLVVLAAAAAPVFATVGERSADQAGFTTPPPDLAQPGAWTDRAIEVARATLPPDAEMGNPPTEYWAQEFYLMWADLTNPEGGRTQLLVYLELDEEHAATDDVCAVRPLDARFSGEETVCRPITVDSLLLRVGSRRDTLPDTTPEVEFAFEIVSRYGDGWAVHVWELPYQHPMLEDGTEPELADTPVFTTQQLAELAAHPDLVPPTG